MAPGDRGFKSHPRNQRKEKHRSTTGVFLCLISSPVFFWELSAQLRALLERYIYPGALDHHQEIAAIYTMYQPERVTRSAFAPHAETIRMMASGFLRDVIFTELMVNQTQSWETGRSDLYLNIDPSYAERFEALHAERWPKDLENAREAGSAFARRIIGD